MNNEPTGVVATEPIATVGAALGATATAGIALLPLFDVDISLAQQGGLITFVLSIITLATIIQRSRVVPTDRANAQIERVAKQDSTFNQAAINELKF